jgi:Ca2+-transporting ATPase
MFDPSFLFPSMHIANTLFCSRIPADCRVVDSIELMVDESALTGENHPVAKTGEALPLAGAAPPALTQQRNMVFAGTLCNAGRGRALVVAVGQNSEFGRIASELSTVETRKSPLQLKIDELGQRLATLSSAFIVVIAICGYFMGRPFLETVTVAVSLAVAAIPEGLPICVTVTLALGVLRMARMNAIVKHLPAVESLGCATVVASDKTGTLTQNEMTSRLVYTLAYPELNFGITGVGYDPLNGELVQTTNRFNEAPSTPRRISKDDEEYTALMPLFQAASLCNNATLSSDGTSGQPTELALLVAASKSGVADPRPLYHRIQEIPFSSDRKRMEVRARPVTGEHACHAFTVAQHGKHSSMFPRRESSSTAAGVNDGSSLYFVKGMPEAVLGECNHFVSKDGSPCSLTEDSRADVLSQSRRMAASGLRVLAMAYGPCLEELTFAGLIGMEDPLRIGVADAVRQLRQSGVKVLMVTGDSKETALAIARRCGIIGNDYEDDFHKGSDGLIDVFQTSHISFPDIEFGASFALSGDELDNIPPSNLPDSIIGVRVFYRVVPKHKLALVRALQKQGEIVAVTGDGVNDALSLKGADIGISMGRSGTDVAKEASDIVLADDDFSTITRAIAEGKGIFFNIRNFLSFQLSTSFAALAIASVATACGLPSPLNAMQILWINIIMDGPPAQSLGVEPVDEKILKAKPRKADDPIVTRALLARCVTSAALIVYLTLKVFSNELDDGNVTRRDTTMTFMTFVNCDLLNAYACRSSERAFYEVSLFSNPAFLWAVGGSIVGQLLVVYFPPLQEVFQTEALSGSDMMYIVFLSSSILWMDALRKKFFASWFSDAYHTSPRSKKEDDAVKMVKSRSWLNFRQLDRSTNSKARNRSALVL